jgi:hypothetical protein
MRRRLFVVAFVLAELPSPGIQAETIEYLNAPVSREYIFIILIYLIKLHNLPVPPISVLTRIADVKEAWAEVLRYKRSSWKRSLFRLSLLPRQKSFTPSF